MGSSFLRRTALTAALATGAATVVAVPSSVAAEQASEARTVKLTGTLLVLAGEGGEPDSYSVKRANGQIVPIDPGNLAAFDDDVASSNRFTGRVRLPVVNGRSTSLRAASVSRIPLPVTSARLHARPTALGPVVHRLAVAQVTNLGAYTRTTPQLLSDFKVATDYWIDQADGNIASFSIPTTFTQYATTKTTLANGCGLNEGPTGVLDFTPVVQEAATLFPGYDFVNGTDQLVVVVPEGCFTPTSKAIGLGAVGVSVSSGGVVLAASSYDFASTLSHEFGHNYGLRHARTATNEYGNIYEVMGSGMDTVPPELGTGYRHEEGLLQPGEVVSLTGRSASTPLLARAGTAETGVRGVELIDPDNGDLVWFDLRTGTGSDAGAGYRLSQTFDGQFYRPAGIVVEQDSEAGTLMHLPGGQTALAAGETWSNASGTMKVSVPALNAAAGTATLSSTYVPGPASAGGTASVTGIARPFEQVRAFGYGFSPAPNGLHFQWFANGAPIPGQEADTFDIPVALAGAALSVQVTAYATGRAPTPVMSTPVTVGPAIFYAGLGAPNVPIITGKTKTGQVLSASGINWVGADSLPPAGLTSTFQWYRGSKAITGATGPTYQLTGFDHRQYISVRNFGAAPGFENRSAKSGSTSRIGKGKIPSSTPKIKFKGKKAKVGSKLKAKPGTWVRKVKFRFQWYANGHKIKRATKKTFVVPRSLRKKKIKVKVTGVKKGYKATARKSSSVKIR